MQRTYLCIAFIIFISQKSIASRIWLMRYWSLDSSLIY